MIIQISKIKIGKRFRKDLGDIDGLAQSMQDVGLLHPIVLDEKDHSLIAGHRRFAAAVKLEWDEIECTKISIDEPKMAQIQENTNRKDFTASEIADIAEYVESHKKAGRPKKGSDSAPFPKGKTDDIVASITKVSHDTVSKIKKIKQAAKENPEKYGKYMEKVDRDRMSIDTAYKLVTQRERSLPKAKLPNGKYDVFLCDIPEKWGRGATTRGAADNHYSTMTPEELVAGIFDGHDIRKIMAKDAVMFFWISTSFQYFEIKVDYSVAMAGFNAGDHHIEIPTPTYKAILDSWGYGRVASEFVWPKDKIGMGSYNRSQHEKCLLAYRGKMPMPAELFPSLIKAPRLEHSRKPEIHDMVEKMFPGRKYCELFPRNVKPRKGWAYFGNESGLQVPEPKKAKENLQEKCKCNHTKILHNTDHKTGENNTGSCVYSMTCRCKKFTTKKSRKVIKA